jgi:O-antigen ligase/polysaccharide polymerase Wzy-like membrane protein
MRGIEIRPRPPRTPDAVWLIGAVLALCYLLPARTVLPGLGAAGAPGLLLGFGCLMLWLLLRLTPGMFAGGHQPLRMVLLLFVCCYLVSYATSFAGGLPAESALGADRTLLRYAGLIGVLLVTLDGLRNRERLLTVLRVLLLVGVAMAVVGLLQFLLHFDLTVHMVPPGLTTHGDLIGIGDNRGGGYHRVASTSGHYIEYGVLMAALSPLALHFTLHGKTAVGRSLAAMAAGLLVFASLASVSRSAILAVVVAAVAMLPAWRFRTMFNLSVLGVGFLVGVSALQPGLLGTFRSLFSSVDSDPNIAGRTSDYEIANRLIFERPWFGHGINSVPAGELLLDNQWLALMISNGLVGTLALAAVILGAMALSWSIGRRGEDPAVRHLGFAIAAPIAAITSSFLTFDALWFSATAVTIFTLLGCAGALWRIERRPEPSRGWAARLPTRPATGVTTVTAAPVGTADP